MVLSLPGLMGRFIST